MKTERCDWSMTYVTVSKHGQSEAYCLGCNRVVPIAGNQRVGYHYRPHTRLVKDETSNPPS